MKRNEFFPPWSNDAKNYDAGLAKSPIVVAVDADRSGRLRREYGKQVCTLAVAGKGINRPAVGSGMIPRGEAGLIFAGIGVLLTLPDAQGVCGPVVSAATFTVAVILVIVMTLLTPPALKWTMGKSIDRLRSITA
jgi:hypothetical protein